MLRRCPLAARSCRVVEGTCSKLRQHYMETQYHRYEKTLADPAYLASIGDRKAEGRIPPAENETHTRQAPSPLPFPPRGA